MEERTSVEELAGSRRAGARTGAPRLAPRVAIAASLFFLVALGAFARQGQTILTVRDGRTFDAIDGATYTIFGPDGFQQEGTTTAFGGQDVFGTLPPGSYLIRVMAATYRTGEVRFEIGEYPSNLPTGFFDTDRIRVELTRMQPVVVGVLDHRIASDRTTPTDENSLLEISGLIDPQQAGRIRQLLDPLSIDPDDLPLPAPAPVLTFLDRNTAVRQRFARPPFGISASVPIDTSGNLDSDGVVYRGTFSSDLFNTILGSGPVVGLARSRYDQVGELSVFEIEQLGAGFGPTPMALDRDGEPRLIYYDEAARRWFELDIDGNPQVPGGFDRTPGSQLGENTGGLQPRAVANPDGGTLTFSSRTSGSIPAGFDCTAGTSEQNFTRFDQAGQIIGDDEIEGSAFSTEIGESCFPPNTTETSDFVFGGRWGVSFQAGDRILLATTNRSVDPIRRPPSSIAAARSASSGSAGVEADRLYELTPQPTELNGVFFWRPAVLGDADSGSFLIDVPNGRTFEGSEDGERLGFAPWPTSNDAFDLPLVSAGELLRHALTVDLSGAPWRIGTFERRLLDGSAPAGERVVAEVPLPGCVDTGRTLCLADNRFAMTASFQTPAGEEGDGQARSLSNESGTFWFFEPENRELIVKVLPACQVNGHYWFFAAGLTDVGVQILLTDPETGIGNLYANPIGRPFEPILDTEALACSEVDVSGARSGTARAGVAVPTARRLGPGTGTAPSSAASSGGSACGGDADDICLAGARFRVEVDYTDFAGATSPAFGGNLTPDTGALFFFDPSNVEMLVKVLDACVFGNYWLFAAGLTNLGVDLRVTDTVTGVSRRYRNPVSQSFQPIFDTSSFPCT